MFFIGIVGDNKRDEIIRKLILNNKNMNENSVIFIKETNIDNIKNVHFDTIIINTEFKEIDKLNRLLKNTRNVIVNMDANIKHEELEIVNSNLITYGFNPKSSITISSVTDDEVLVCIQRNINGNYGKIELQEIKLENSEMYNIYELILVLVVFLMYSPDCTKININS